MSVIDDINTWVFHEYPEELRVTLLDKHEIWVLSTPYEDELHFKIKKGSALEYLKEMFDTLECFHSLLTYNLFRLIKVYYREKRRNPGAPINITLWDFYKYVHRMQAVFSYGKFDVQQWQSDIYSRLKEMENIESLDDFVADSKLQEDKDEKLIITMTEFAYLCQKKHYLPQSECINRVIRKPLLTQTYFNWLSCKMNVPCVRSLEGEVTRNIFRLPEEEMEEREKLILEGLQSSRTEMGFLESQTSDSTKLVENKNEFRLYASKFGRVCKPGPQVTPSSVLKYILLADYSESDAMRYEKTHKIMGIKSFQDETKLKRGQTVWLETTA
ncbi:uncharacterized protein LOC126842023 [Adelges cooleyi]|uniref:uncharacterized protein LOC126842023 n=1 Tax=Adelges cooleyi TaxID=133065 RepID=UPI00217FD31D|nr:uncharacterized protein LOC126842023 [Adelges cooleyi]